MENRSAELLSNQYHGAELHGVQNTSLYVSLRSSLQPGDGHSILILLMDKLRFREVREPEQVDTPIKQKNQHSLDPDLCCPILPLFSAQTLWKRFLVFSSRPRWHSVHAQPGQTSWGKGQLMKLIVTVQSGMEWGFLWIPKNASLSAGCAGRCLSLGFPGHN